MPIYSIHAVHTVHAISLLPLLPLPLNSKRPQSLQVDTSQRALLRSLQVNLRDGASRDAATLKGPEGLEPPARTQAPLAPFAEAHGAKVVALARRVIEKILRDDARHGVIAAVHRGGAAVAIAVEACHRLCREEL